MDIGVSGKKLSRELRYKLVKNSVEFSLHPQTLTPLHPQILDSDLIKGKTMCTGERNIQKHLLMVQLKQ